MKRYHEMTRSKRHDNKNWLHGTVNVALERLNFSIRFVLLITLPTSPSTLLFTPSQQKENHQALQLLDLLCAYQVIHL